MDVPLVRQRMHVNRDTAMTGRWPDSGDADFLFDRSARGDRARWSISRKVEADFRKDPHRRTCKPPIQV
jgi:hypothetical protein